MSTSYKRHTPLRHRQHAIHLFARRLLHEDIHEALLSVNQQRRREFNWQAIAEVVLVELIEPKLAESRLTISNAEIQALGASRREAETILTKFKQIGLLIPVGRGSKQVGVDEDGKPILKRGFAYFEVNEKYVEEHTPATPREAWIITHTQCEKRGITDAREQAHVFWSAKDIARSRLKKDRLTPAETVWGLEQLFKDRDKKWSRVTTWGGQP